MLNLIRILFFSLGVTSTRRQFREDYLLERCLLVARECCKHDDPFGIAIEFSTNPEFSITNVSEANVKLLVDRAAQQHCHDTCERIEAYLSSMLPDDKKGDFISPEIPKEPLPTVLDNQLDLRQSPDLENATADPAADATNLSPTQSQSEATDLKQTNPTPDATVLVTDPPNIASVSADPATAALIEEDKNKHLQADVKMGIATVDLPLTSKQKQALVAGGLNTVREILAYHNEKDLESLAGIGATTRDFIIKVISEIGG